MDEEDGLLGTAVAASDDYDTLGAGAAEAARQAAAAAAGGGEKASGRGAPGRGGAAGAARGPIIPGPAPLELVCIPGQPIGKRLLSTMGWREGTGVGARVSARRKQKVAAVGASGGEPQGAEGAGSGSSVSVSEMSGAGGGSSVAEVLGASLMGANTGDGGEGAPEDVTFAPDDQAARVPIPKPKADNYGVRLSTQQNNSDTSTFLVGL